MVCLAGKGDACRGRVSGHSVHRGVRSGNPGSVIAARGSWHLLQSLATYLCHFNFHIKSLSFSSFLFFTDEEVGVVRCWLTHTDASAEGAAGFEPRPLLLASVRGSAPHSVLGGVGNSWLLAGWGRLGPSVHICLRDVLWPQVWMLCRLLQKEGSWLRIGTQAPPTCPE